MHGFNVWHCGDINELINYDLQLQWYANYLINSCGESLIILPGIENVLNFVQFGTVILIINKKCFNWLTKNNELSVVKWKMENMMVDKN